MLDRPRNAPARTALGAAVITQGGVLLLAGGDDVISMRFGVPFEGLVWFFRVGFFLFPVIAFVLARRMCLALQRRDRRWLARGRPAGIIERLPVSRELAMAFLGVDPIPPSEPVETGANEKYFRQWQELKHSVPMRAYLDLVSVRYERGMRRYGYSLLSP